MIPQGVDGWEGMHAYWEPRDEPPVFVKIRHRAAGEGVEAAYVVALEDGSGAVALCCDLTPIDGEG